MNTLTSEKAKADKEGSSRMSNLNQALVQAKHSCTHLTEQVETHKRREWELAQKVEDLQLASALESKAKAGTPVRGTPVRGTPVRSGIFFNYTPAGPIIPAETEVDSLRTDNRKLKQDLSCLQTNFELTTQKSVQLRAQLKEAESSLLDLQNQFEKNLTEKEELQNQFDVLKDGLKSQNGTQVTEKVKILELTEQVEKSRVEIDQLRQQNLDLKRKSGLEQKLDSQDMAEKLDSVKKSLVEEKSMMKEEMVTLQEELDGLHDKCRGLESSSGVHLEDKKKYATAVSALKSKMSKLSKEKKELSRQLQKASEKLDQANDKIHLYKEEVGALEANLKAKEKENATLSSKNKDQSHLPSELDELSAKVVATLEEMEELRSKNTNHEAAKEKLENRVAELSKTNAKLGRESKHGSELARKMTTELEKLEDRCQSLQNDLEAKTEECNLTQRKLRSAKQELSTAASAKDSHQGEATKMEGRINELEQKNFELSTNLTSSLREVETVAKTRSDNEHKLLQLESKLDAAEFVILEKESHISDLKCAYELMEAENSTLLSQVTSLSEMVSTRNFKLEAHQMQSVHHESEVLEIMERISELEAEHGACPEVISKLESKNEKLEGLLEASANSRNETEQKVSSLQAEVEKLGRLIAKMKTDKKDLQDEVASRVTKYEELKLQSAAAEARVNELKRDLRTESLALVAAREDLSYVKKTHGERKLKMEEKIESLETKLTDLSLQCDNSHREKVELKSKVTEFRAELKEQVLLNSALKIQRDSLSEQYESLKESALSVLQCDSSADGTTGASGEENLSLRANTSSPPPGTKKKGVKSILKKSRSLKTLHPVQD